MNPNNRDSTLLAYIILFFAPAFFTTNIVFGKMLLSVEPFTLAFLRWAISATILFVFCQAYWSRMVTVFKDHTLRCIAAAFLAFWICGGMVYFALHYTSATNGTLIYTTPPVLILAIEAIWRDRKVQMREVFGIIVAVGGAIIIIIKGDIANLLSLRFNPGDLIFLSAAVAWAIYSVMLKSEAFAELNTVSLLALLAGIGSVLLLPFAVYETLSDGAFPNSIREWQIIAGIVAISSLLAFSAFQFGIRQLGASMAGIFLYLLPPWFQFFSQQRPGKKQSPWWK
ncbi:MAG: DMT family transporter [Pseudomonadota bacterium]